MRGRLRPGMVAAGGIAAAAIAIPITSVAARPGHQSKTGTVGHVVLISVDGLHQSDLTWWVSHHPQSELARLVGRGVEYTNARTVIPSDSDPGMTAQMTGGDPKVTGVYYDVEYNHALLPAGTTTCPAGAALGAPVIFDSPDDKDVTRLDAGQGLSGLPGSILQMTGTPQTLLNPASFPVDPHTCKPIYPHSYLKVNTIFEVIHNHGLRTAWSDKHAVYESFNGPSGQGIDDLFAPEIDSNALKPDGTPYPGAVNWTGDNAATMQYDSYKVRAVLNEIDGYDHSRTQKVGVPAILGMNFQTVSTAEKLPVSDGLRGGYLPGTDTPGPLLRRALGYINDRLAAMSNELRAQGIAGSTGIVLSAKHGQSPQNPLELMRIDDGPIIDGINAAWKAAHPGAGDLVVSATDDDAVLMYLSDRSQAAADFVKQYLLSHSATGNTYNTTDPSKAGAARTLLHSGLTKVYAGAGAAAYFGVPMGDPRHPDIWGIVQHGVVYTGGTGKIAEHGGPATQDRHVALTVYAPRAIGSGVVGREVETRQIAPTILRLLGLDPSSLKAVRLEGTQVLPGL